MWFCFLMGISAFLRGFIKLSEFLITVFIYKTISFNRDAVIYTLSMLAIMAFGVFVIKLGVNQMKLKNKDKENHHK